MIFNRRKVTFNSETDIEVLVNLIEHDLRKKFARKCIFVDCTKRNDIGKKDI